MIAGLGLLYACHAPELMDLRNLALQDLPSIRMDRATTTRARVIRMAVVRGVGLHGSSLATL